MALDPVPRLYFQDTVSHFLALPFSVWFHSWAQFFEEKKKGGTYVLSVATARWDTLVDFT